MPCHGGPDQAKPGNTRMRIDTHVPIPNTTVMTSSADDTWGADPERIKSYDYFGLN